jgi:hypothetical protein
MVVENRVVPLLDDVIQVAKIVQEANRIFLKDQVSYFSGSQSGCTGILSYVTCKRSRVPPNSEMATMYNATRLGVSFNQPRVPQTKKVWKLMIMNTCEGFELKIVIFDKAESGGDATTCCARPDAANNNHNNHHNGGNGRRGVPHSIRTINECGSQVRCLTLLSLVKLLLLLLLLLYCLFCTVTHLRVLRLVIFSLS